jgi:hypothetical protein
VGRYRAFLHTHAGRGAQKTAQNQKAGQPFKKTETGRKHLKIKKVAHFQKKKKKSRKSSGMKQPIHWSINRFAIYSLRSLMNYHAACGKSFLFFPFFFWK